MVKKIRWSAPAGSSYQTRPTRRQQSLQLAGTGAHDGGEVPTHDQVAQFAEACQHYYQFGEGLIHVAANTGPRASELFLFTASKAVADQNLGNLVDLANGVIVIRVQKNDDPTKAYKKTKSGMVRSVVIPSEHKIATGFNVRAWLEQRCSDALLEQQAGTNPLALIFPNSSGGVLDVNNFGTRVTGRAADKLSWRMTTYTTAQGKKRAMRRFTLHAMRDRFATTAVDEWNYSESELLDQGSWSDRQTVQKYYLGRTDKTLDAVKSRHGR
jgi:hypothetical protein